MTIKDINGETHIVKLDDGQLIFTGGVANRFVCMCNNDVDSVQLNPCDDTQASCLECQKAYAK